MFYRILAGFCAIYLAIGIVGTLLKDGCIPKTWAQQAPPNAVGFLTGRLFACVLLIYIIVSLWRYARTGSFKKTKSEPPTDGNPEM